MDNNDCLSAFVIMPFDEELEWVFIDIIEPVLIDAKFRVTRADTELHQRNILEDIVVGINEADLIIADLTNSNPNVMYELGIAHGLQKPVYMITQDIDATPFDLRAYRLNQYSTSYPEAVALKSRLKDTIESLVSGNVRFGNPVSDFVGTASPRLEHRKAASLVASDHMSSQIEDIPIGLFDFIEIIETNTEIIEDWTSGLVGGLADLGSDFQARTMALNEIVPGDSNSLKRQRQIIAAVTNTINKWAIEIEADIPNASSAWSKMENASEEFLSIVDISNEEGAEAAAKLRSQMIDLATSLSTARVEVKEFRENMASIPNVSRDFSRSISKARRALSEIDTTLEQGISFAERVVTVINKRMGDEPTS